MGIRFIKFTKIIKVINVITIIMLFEVFLAPVAQAAVMSSTSYQIQIDSVNMGGARSTSSSYALEQTSGEIGTGKIANSQNLYAGFQLPLFPAATTTTTDTGGGGGPAFIPFEILDVVIQQVTSDTAVITFRTNTNATTQVGIGSAPNARDRTIVVTAEPNSAHSVTIDNLLPNTPYYFDIAAESERQEYTRSGEGSFKTLPSPGPPAKEPPANVEGFTATPGDKQISLQWQNPADTDFAGVRIVRSTDFYPATPLDGTHIYGGAGQEFLDTNVQNGRQYYYTAFAYDTDGNFASGAVATAIPSPPGVYPERPKGVERVPPHLIPKSLKDLSFLDFDFIQGNAKTPVVNGRVEIGEDRPFTIAIEYDKLPEILKTILVTMRDAQGKSFSFLLRVNEEKTRYLATMKPPASGLYQMNFVVVDYQNQGLQQIAGELEVKEAFGASVAPPAPYRFGRFFPEILIFLLISLLIVGMWYILKKYIGSRYSVSAEYIG